MKCIIQKQMNNKKMNNKKMWVDVEKTSTLKDALKILYDKQGVCGDEIERFRIIKEKIIFVKETTMKMDAEGEKVFEEGVFAHG